MNETAGESTATGADPAASPPPVQYAPPPGYVLAPGTAPAAERPWYKRPAIMVPLGLLAVVIIAGAASGSGEADKGVSYSGTDLAADVTRTLTDGGDKVSGITCADTPIVAIDVITDCKGVVNGAKTGIRVTFDDDKGHFTLDEQSAG